MSAETVTGKTVVIRFAAERCIHSRHGVLDRPDVFVLDVQGEAPRLAMPTEGFEAAAGARGRRWRIKGET